jgi:hypothetical protein
MGENMKKYELEEIEKIVGLGFDAAIKYRADIFRQVHEHLCLYDQEIRSLIDTNNISIYEIFSEIFKRVSDLNRAQKNENYQKRLLTEYLILIFFMFFVREKTSEMERDLSKLLYHQLEDFPKNLQLDKVLDIFLPLIPSLLNPEKFQHFIGNSIFLTLVFFKQKNWCVYTSLENRLLYDWNTDE